MELQTTNAINIGSKGTVINPSSILSNIAPKWFVDGVRERIKQGDSEQVAIAAMRSSPFFKNEWIA